MSFLTRNGNGNCDLPLVANEPVLWIATMTGGTILYFEKTPLTANGVRQTATFTYGSSSVQEGVLAPVSLGATIKPEIGTPFFSQASIGEVIYYSRALNTTDIAILRGYLAGRWTSARPPLPPLPPQPPSPPPSPPPPAPPPSPPQPPPSPPPPSPSPFQASPIVAFSIRRIIPTYGGPSVAVRHSVSGEVADLYPVSMNGGQWWDLQTITGMPLFCWLNGATAFVRTWCVHCKLFLVHCAVNSVLP